MTLGDNNWIDCDSYWLHKYPQLTKEWIEERSYRLTTSLFGPVADPTFYRGREDVIKQFVDPPIKKDFIDELASSHGIINEPIARKLYESRYGCQVDEVGLAVPKWDHRIGASTDGVVVGTEGLIEIKSPGRMYSQINRYVSSIASGWNPPAGYHDHIFTSHYNQMQGAMAIMGKQWCDYIIFCPNDNKFFLERVDFNPDYWTNHLYPEIVLFLDVNKELFSSLRRKVGAPPCDSETFLLPIKPV